MIQELKQLWEEYKEEVNNKENEFQKEMKVRFPKLEYELPPFYKISFEGFMDFLSKKK